MTDLEKLNWLKAWYDDRKADLQSQPAIVKAIKGDSVVESTIGHLYRRLYNKPIVGCSSCLADALTVLIHYSNTHMQAIMECKFTLKTGVLLADPFNRLPMVTTANITDDIALAYLKDNPARKQMFSVMPDNVDELIAAYGADATAEAANADEQANERGEEENAAEAKKTTSKRTAKTK